ncbi:hypothetical protein NQD34_016686 [Periophthalmus magnuspinnatus]|nr:hypothetical protein NQD34_016686 [Periophthalmus magnuspinnatus]
MGDEKMNHFISQAVERHQSDLNGACDVFKSALDSLQKKNVDLRREIHQAKMEACSGREKFIFLKLAVEAALAENNALKEENEQLNKRNDPTKQLENTTAKVKRHQELLHEECPSLTSHGDEEDISKDDEAQVKLENGEIRVENETIQEVPESDDSTTERETFKKEEKQLEDEIAVLKSQRHSLKSQFDTLKSKSSQSENWKQRHLELVAEQSRILDDAKHINDKLSSMTLKLAAETNLRSGTVAKLEDALIRENEQLTQHLEKIMKHHDETMTAVSGFRPKRSEIQELQRQNYNILRDIEDMENEIFHLKALTVGSKEFNTDTAVMNIKNKRLVEKQQQLHDELKKIVKSQTDTDVLKNLKNEALSLYNQIHALTLEIKDTSSIRTHLKTAQSEKKLLTQRNDIAKRGLLKVLKLQRKQKRSVVQHKHLNVPQENEESQNGSVEVMVLDHAVGDRLHEESESFESKLPQAGEWKQRHLELETEKKCTLEDIEHFHKQISMMTQELAEDEICKKKCADLEMTNSVLKNKNEEWKEHLCKITREYEEKVRAFNYKQTLQNIERLKKLNHKIQQDIDKTQSRIINSVVISDTQKRIEQELSAEREKHEELLQKQADTHRQRLMLRESAERLPEFKFDIENLEKLCSLYRDIYELERDIEKARPIEVDLKLKKWMEERNDDLKKEVSRLRNLKKEQDKLLLKNLNQEQENEILRRGFEFKHEVYTELYFQLYSKEVEMFLKRRLTRREGTIGLNQD